MWASIRAGYGLGGQSIVNNQPKNDDRSDILFSGSYGLVVSKMQAIKFTYIRTQTLKNLGADLNSFVLGWSAVF